jgi:tRNA pseudouridine13 synthase
MEKFNTITEEDVGITEYINNTNKGFKCVLKHRYSDFIVNEIDENGNVVWIKEENKAIEDIVSNTNNEQKEELTEEKADSIINNKIKPIITNETDINNISKFISNYIYKQNLINASIDIEYINDKQQRKLFHELLRENFPFLDSETTEDKETKHKQIRITYITKQSYYKRRKVFPDKTKTCLHLSMLKRNMDTVGAINYISRLIHHSTKSIKFAGNKDKRGITTQRISCYNTLPNEITSAMKSKSWNRNIELGNFIFKSNELRLGMLKGNQFCVALRFINIDNENLLYEIINGVNKEGFVNYFGMQRFGVSDIPTHDIGKCVIKKQWKEAFIKIVSTDCVFDAMKQLNVGNIITDVFDNADKKKQLSIINDILKIIPKYTTEYKLLNNYIKSGVNSFQSSFKCLNKQLQVLYPHAYQSYIWNKCVSYRLRELGRILVIGDIVKKHSALYQEKTQEEDCDDLQDEDNTHDNVNNSNNNTNDIFNNNFEYINEDNIMKFNFDDLVMPIVGYEIRYPQNKVKDYIEMLLKEDGLSFKDFEYQSVNFNACGYFRKVIEKPLNDMKIEIVHHDNPDEDIQNEYYNIEPHPQLKGTKYTSARLVFQLPQSTYATMLFREITKHSSAGNYQANLSLNIKDNNNNNNNNNSI